MNQIGAGSAVYFLWHFPEGRPWWPLATTVALPCSDFPPRTYFGSPAFIRKPAAAGGFARLKNTDFSRHPKIGTGRPPDPLYSIDNELRFIIADVCRIFEFIRSKKLLPRQVDVFGEVFIVSIGEISSKVGASTFTTLLGRLCNKQGDGEHVLALPAFRRFECLVHDVSLPKADDFLGLCKGCIRAGDADISPHQGPKRVSHVLGIEPGTVGMGDLVLYKWAIYLGRAGLRGLGDCPSRYSAEDEAFEQ